MAIINAKVEIPDGKFCVSKIKKNNNSILVKCQFCECLDVSAASNTPKRFCNLYNKSALSLDYDEDNTLLPKKLDVCYASINKT